MGKKPTQVNVYGRLSYEHVWEPNPDGKYSCALIIDPKNEEQMKHIRAAIEAAKQAYKSKLAGADGVIPKNIKIPLRDAEEEGKTEKELQGMMWFNAKSDHKPEIVDGNLEPVMSREAVYSGCYVNVLINFYGYNTGTNKGVGAGLGPIQLVKDGERLDGGVSAADAFSVIKNNDDFLNY